jgi:hypothetical protein
MAEPPSWWTQVRVTELSALVSGAAFVCGLGYNGAYFSVLEPRFFSVLDFWDHIKTAISFLPFTMLFLAFGAFEGDYGPGAIGIVIAVKVHSWLARIRGFKSRVHVVVGVCLLLLACPPIWQRLGVLIAVLWLAFEGLPAAVVRVEASYFPRWIAVAFTQVVVSLEALANPAPLPPPAAEAAPAAVAAPATSAVGGA